LEADPVAVEVAKRSDSVEIGTAVPSWPWTAVVSEAIKASHSIENFCGTFIYKVFTEADEEYPYVELVGSSLTFTPPVDGTPQELMLTFAAILQKDHGDGEGIVEVNRAEQPFKVLVIDCSSTISVGPPLEAKTTTWYDANMEYDVSDAMSQYTDEACGRVILFSAEVVPNDPSAPGLPHGVTFDESTGVFTIGRCGVDAPAS
jgi:hypothetical protein